MLKLKLQYFGHLIGRVTHWKIFWCWERFRAGREGGDGGWGGWMASSTQWTWVWADSGRQWSIEKPGMLKKTEELRMLQARLSSNSCSNSFMSDSLRPDGLQHTRLPSHSPSPGVSPNSCPLSWWCQSIISSSVVPFSACLQSFPSLGSFPMSWLFESDSHKYWSISFSNSPSNEYSGLISFRID